MKPNIEDVNGLDPKPGEKYICVKAFQAPAYTFKVGDKFVIMDKTVKAPFGLLNEKGNWLVKGPNGLTVWSQFDRAIESGLVRKMTVEGVP